MAAAQVEVVVYSEPSNPQPTFSRSGPSFPRLRVPSALEIAVSALHDELVVFRREGEVEIPEVVDRTRRLVAASNRLETDRVELINALECLIKTREEPGALEAHSIRINPLFEGYSSFI